MKIVINNCFGGYSLSAKVQTKLIKLGVLVYDSFETVPNKETSLYLIKKDKDKFNFDNTNYWDNSDEHRTNPILIQAIEEVGLKKSSGMFAELKIIDLPDDVNYQINDYDGHESIHEQHRSWS